MASFSLVSLGCAKNQVDSEIMLSVLEDLGLQYVPDHEEADIIVVNTCSFITSAKNESIETTLGLKDRYPKKKVFLAGCLAQRYAGALAEELPEIDGFLFSRNPDDIGAKVTEKLESLPAGGLAGRATAASLDMVPRRRRLLSYTGSAYVKIADGCDNRCSYCAIPLIKGGLQSRSRSDILEEVRRLLSAGTFEINLVAQDLASFGQDRGSPEIELLLDEIGQLEGDFWIRCLYIHPDHFPREMLKSVAENPRLLPYFDIPFQHASPGILKAMGRKGSAGSYLRLVEDIRAELPEAIIRSTFLVGFPGEQDSDFHRLIDFQRDAQLDWLGIFEYSREEGTDASRYRGQVKSRLAAARLKVLQDAQEEITRGRVETFVGRELTCLVEEPVVGQDLFLGRGFMHAPEVDGLILLHGKGYQPGDRVRVRIFRRNGIDLEAVAKE